MKIEIRRGLTQSQVVQGDLVIVYGDHDNPIAVAADLGDNIVAEVGTPENQAAFNALLRNLGINKTVVFGRVFPRPLADIHV